MNGIEFIVRDRAGWVPRIPLPRRRIPAEEVRQVRTMPAKKPAAPKKSP
ncbi:hypothetical protein LMG26858_04401 [Achromobacter anxifer]|uniref:Uncharacterized protein n=1 Tax=Achromobacter anxifer TaxID=1287737 RepID=A0A6S7EBP2_9BURK|nr:hypothetical protein LMG26858_04401 [Achromobacter anxifer]